MQFQNLNKERGGGRSAGGMIRDRSPQVLVYIQYNEV